LIFEPVVFADEGNHGAASLNSQSTCFAHRLKSLGEKQAVVVLFDSYLGFAQK
jgi:hypothetical protein